MNSNKAPMGVNDRENEKPGNTKVRVKGNEEPVLIEVREFQ